MPGRAAVALVHTGRSSGRTYRTPLDADPLPDGYLFVPLYGPSTDWVRNVLAAAPATLSIDGQEIELDRPLMVRRTDVWPLLPPTSTAPPGIRAESELLRMDIHRRG